MADRHQPWQAQRDADDPVVVHEASDVNVRAVFAFGAALAVSMMFIAFGVWLLLRFFDARERGRSPGEYPLAAAQQTRVPPEPRLQTQPREDLKEFRAREDDTLKTYGWVDRNAGVVRIPIDQAM
jgi:hypothetical protein